jgi:hypothetical protein
MWRRGVAMAVGLAAGVVMAGVTAPADDQARAWRRADAPPALDATIRQAEDTFDEFQERLLSRVGEELSRGGAMAAIGVYSDEAQTLAQTLARRERFIRIGRTSHRLRNFRNLPPEWAVPYVNERSAVDFVRSPTWVVEISSTAIGVLMPLETTPTCVACHGPADTLSPPLLGALRAKYPGDQATGFTPGEVRGWLWAELSRR